MTQNNCKLIGITGGIASGKTTVKNILIDKDYIVIDSDIIARDVVKINKPAYQKVIEYFGDDILYDDNTIDRKKLSDIVFNDANERKILEGILYPYIFKEILAQIHNKCVNDMDIIFVDIPLLFENIKSIVNSGISFDQIWLVYCDRKTQLERLLSRDNISLENANLRLNAQIDIEEKRKMADVIIENMTTKDFLIKQIDVCLAKLKQDKIWNARYLL